MRKSIAIEDPVAPSHYQGDECALTMERIADNYDAVPTRGAVTSHVLTAVKYIWRAPLKGGAEDLKKGVWYLQRAIKLLEKA